MLKKPLIVGSKGAMGRRYAAVLRHLGVEFVGIDQGDPVPDLFDSVIICTPTPNHLPQIVRFASHKVPILCEKPISTNVGEALEVCDWAEEKGIDLQMVNQYAYLENQDTVGSTVYNYWNHGRDGLTFDCISVLALARGPVQLAENSPVWTCQINGLNLDLRDMDRAYIAMIHAWLMGDRSFGPEYIRHAHKAVAAYIEGHK
jgi:hypothetical protein